MSKKALQKYTNKDLVNKIESYAEDIGRLDFILVEYIKNGNGYTGDLSERAKLNETLVDQEILLNELLRRLGEDELNE